MKVEGLVFTAGYKEQGVGAGKNTREEILADIHPVRENHSEKAREDEWLRFSSQPCRGWDPDAYSSFTVLRMTYM